MKVVHVDGWIIFGSGFVEKLRICLFVLYRCRNCSFNCNCDWHGLPVFGYRGCCRIGMLWRLTWWFGCRVKSFDAFMFFSSRLVLSV